MLQKLSQDEYQRRSLLAEQLQCCFESTQFSFLDTSELSGLKEGIVGQERAVKALEFGLSMTAIGYNIFVVGPVGTGKTTYAIQKIQEMAQTKPTPNDWCYVYNFRNPDQPLALSFAPGQGQRFRLAMEQLVREVEQELVRQFDSDEYHQESGHLLKKFNEQAEQVWTQLDTQARQLGIGLQRTATGVVTVPLGANGRPLNAEQFEQLPEGEQLPFRVHQQNVEDMFEETVRQIKAMQKEAGKAQQVLEEKTAAYAIAHLYEEIVTQFPNEKVQQFFIHMKEDVIAHQRAFRREQDGEQTAMPRMLEANFDPRQRYQVNVMVDQQGHQGAPVVTESNPTFFNLFGKTEYHGNNGVMTSDYTLIKPGALHRANGGYLIVQAQDLLTHPNSWQGLKRALKTGEIRIDNPAEETLWMVPSGLRPEAIPLNVKVILIGTGYIYHLLYENDEALRKYFKVKVEFDAQMDRTSDSCQKYANFIASYTTRQSLPPFSKEAVVKVIDYSARQAGHQKKLSTQFNPIIELITEASFYAQSEGRTRVEEEHVNLALTKKIERSSLVKEKVLELILDGTIRVTTQGTRVGQINGLAVLNNGDFLFGQPHRITARTYVGKRGVVNVERETAMSGHIHDKGLLILGGYLAGEFAQTRVMSLSASLVFEQTYSMIDGDSASSTELYVLLSSISGVPIKQGIAVTGSVDQFGEIQPIGGVNEKIEGFFYICQAQGLTGDQGVVIPFQNVVNLFLTQEVVDAVRAGQFHIWPVKTVKEGFEILTGVVAGEEQPYAPDTAFGLIEQRLQKISEGLPRD